MTRIRLHGPAPFLAVAAGLLLALTGGVARAGDTYVLYMSDLDDACVNLVSSVEVSFGLDSSDGGELVGYSWGVCHSEDTLSLDEGDVSNGGTVDDIEFFFHSLSYFDEGWTVGSLFSLSGYTLDPGDYEDMYTGAYNVDADGDATVEYCGTLGDPTVSVSVLIGTEEIEPTTEDGAFTVLAEDDEDCVGVTFVRGDANDDGNVTIGDAVYAMRATYQDGPAIGCAAAGDADNDGDTDTDDILRILRWIFLDGDEPESPFPDCGGGDSDDDCETSSC